MAIRLSRTFILRKLHQLTGIMPLGFFLLEHFYTNSKALNGAAKLFCQLLTPSGNLGFQMKKCRGRFANHFRCPVTEHPFSPTAKEGDYAFRGGGHDRDMRRGIQYILQARTGAR